MKIKTSLTLDQTPETRSERSVVGRPTILSTNERITGSWSAAIATDTKSAHIAAISAIDNATEEAPIPVRIPP
jgi:hypothetical protein